MQEITNEYGTTYFPDDVFAGEKGHPQCCFFELFASSQDPYETFYGLMFCHMDMKECSAQICKGDYLKCPLAGNIEIVKARIK